jgi:hypothetical protein
MSGMSIGHIPWNFGKKLLHGFSSIALCEMRFFQNIILLRVTCKLI